MKRAFLSVIILSALIISLKGQDVKVTSAFDSSKIYIGDQIKYTITVDKPSGMKISLPVLRDTVCKNIEILSGPHTDSSSAQNGRTRIIQKYLVTSFDSGYYKAKPVYAEARTSEGLKRFYSGYSAIDVMRVHLAPADTASKYYDIIKPYSAPITLAEILPWILIAILAGVVVWGAIILIRKYRKKTEENTPYIPPDPAHVIAFRELEQLRNEQLWQKGETKKYYTRLTEILRQYLENRYSVLSLELTTAETLDALLKTGFRKNGSFDALKSVLTGADLVKFAKYSPVPEENDTHYQSSWDFVMATKAESNYELEDSGALTNEQSREEVS